MAIRAIPALNNWGYDFILTKKDYPRFPDMTTHASWYWIGQLTYVLHLGFVGFWIIISILFGIGMNVFLNTFYNANNTTEYPAATFCILCIFLAGYILPWYAYAHVRHAIAIMFLLPALIIEKGIKKYLLIIVAVSFHTLALVYFLFDLIAKNRNKFLQIVMLIVLGTIILFKDVVLYFLLGLISYDVYSGDLAQFEFDSSNTFMVVRVILFFLVIIISTPSSSRNYLSKINLLYFVTIMLTPFSGRILEFFYPSILIRIEKKNYYTLALLFVLVVIDFISTYYKFMNDSVKG